MLVVDDNREVANGFVLLLQTMGAETRTAYDGESALPACRNTNPTSSSSTWASLPPASTGSRWGGESRALREGTSIVLAMLSGWGGDEYRRRSEETGFDHHFVKPIEIAALENILATIAPRGGLSNET